MLLAEQLNIAEIATGRRIAWDGDLQHQTPRYACQQGEPGDPLDQLLIRGGQQGAARQRANQMPLAVIGGQRQRRACLLGWLDHQQGGRIVGGGVDGKLQQQLAATGGQHGLRSLLQRIGRR